MMIYGCEMDFMTTFITLDNIKVFASYLKSWTLKHACVTPK